MGYVNALGARAIVPSLAAVLASALLTGLTASRADAAGGDFVTAGSGGAGASFHATIRRTSHGVPNITGEDWGSLGFGYGYAFAQDNICTMADTYVTVRGERSRYFDPDASYVSGGNGSTNNNLNSDFFFQRIIDSQVIEGLLAQAPPIGPREEIKQGVAGYVAGYNKYLADTGVDNLPDARCAGADWVKPITQMDAYRRFYQLGLLASAGVAIDGIGGATPPPTGAGGAPPSPDQVVADLGKQLPFGGIGSNAVALGKEATDNGSGMMLGNPHFPWDGSERFYQAHLTMPGKVNVSGAGLFGVPLVLIGHTQNLAWSHTVSTAFRFTPFELKLDPSDPTRYLYDGSFRDMTADEVTVQVRTDSGLEPRTRTLYSTLQGPILTSILGLPIFPWTPATAWALGDANADNFRYLNHFFETDQAQSVGELDEILKRNQGIPWVNTIAADSSGKAFYADYSVVPHVTNEQATECNTALGNATYQALGLPVLDGSRSACEWGSDADAVRPGIFGPSNLPSLFRDDYVTNSNDSYWLSNPESPIEGYDRIIGDERTERSLRTRLGLRIVQQRLDGTDGEPGARFTRQQLQDAVFNNRQYAGELWRDNLADLCESAPGGFLLGTGGPVDVSEACPVLRGWNLHDNLNSNGAILFRRFASRVLGAVPVVGDPTIYTTPFSASDPVNTPNGLNPASPNVESALADAVSDLRKAGIPLDAPLLGYQYEKRGEEAIPIHGGPGTVGVFNAINVGWNSNPANPGYPNVPHGSSFVMVTQFGGGCPDDRSILTYSLSDNPSSPYFADQTRLFSEKKWVDPPFCESEVLADPNLMTTEIEGCAAEGCGPDTEPHPDPDLGGGHCKNAIVGTRGDDRLDGGAVSDRISGRAGDDRIRGRGGADCLSGQRGADRIAGGGGRDAVAGGPGDDRLFTRDGGRDVVRCGPGEDVVNADPSDMLRGCETARQS